ncbi:MAG: HAD-IC family P-type ATPase, partial [Pseudomonadota bacterium]|nr:HAD-IC family P-type ATPase [Pseudomonadota bacterium]
PVPLTAARRAAIVSANAAMAEKGLRVLGFAYREDAGQVPGPISGLIWAGLAGLTDPVRDGAAELMHRLQSAGVHPLVMTGDQAATARAVAEELGLAGIGTALVVEGADIDALDDPALGTLARRADAFARVSPAQKLAIIRALQASGSLVVMVGDGFNDTPALKAADVGIAMGAHGAEAAREAAGVVLVSDQLGTLADAIERGRATRADVRRAMRYLLGTNLSEILVVLAGTAVGVSQPLTPLQLLWINLISDVLPGIGLACEPPADGLMRQPPPARDDRILDAAEWRRLSREGSLIAAGALGAGAWGALRYGASPQAQTMTFGSLVLGQLLHALACRDPEAGRNPTLTGALAISFAAQAVALLVPGLRGALGIAPIGSLDIAVALAGGILPMAANLALRAPAAPPPSPS